MKALYLDHETYNELDIKEVGTYAYCASPSLEIMLTAWAKGPGDVRMWDRSDTDARDYEEERFYDACDEADVFIAHHATFDRNVSKVRLDHPKLHDRDRWRCTMVKAFLHGFPGSLDALCRILKVPEDQAKLKAGKTLINRFCKPSPKRHKIRRYDRWTHPREWANFVKYGALDIHSMRAVNERLPDLNDDPDLYNLDQLINDRGFLVDRELVEAGARESADEAARFAHRFAELVGPGELKKPTQREKFKDHMWVEYGIDLPNTTGDTLAEYIADESLHPTARELMQIAVSSNKTSTAKYGALLPALSPDNRFRGGLQFSGAARTRRWAGRVFQPHNLPSRGLPKPDSVARFIRALKAGVVAACGFDDPMLHASAAIRGVVVAEEGKWLSVADLSNIEGRVAAWFAAEKWKLQAFRDFDTFVLDADGVYKMDAKGKRLRKGPDLYRVTAAMMLNKAVEDVTQEERDKLGKVAELALGYEGGVGALQNFAGGKMTALLPVLEESVPDALAGAVDNWHKWGQPRATVDYDEWVASDAVKLAWRNRHPRIKRLWKDCDKAARAAIQQPGTSWRVGRLKFYVDIIAGFKYLICEMPSGNSLCYFDPRITRDDRITYMGADPVTKQWVVLDLYGGKIVENVCQSFARDILAHNMPEAERRGFRLVLTVHDENVTESDEPRADELAEIMAINPDYTPGLPLAAAGFDCKRYRKG